MLLTGKALEDFYKWYNCREGNTLTNNDLFYYSEELIQNTLIIEWFDLVGLIINVKRFTHLLEFREWYYIITNKQGVHLNNYLKDLVNTDSRQQAIKQAIIKANEIYNDNNR